MNIAILSSSYGPMPDSARVICASNCLDCGIIEGRFADAEGAGAFARRELSTYYIARDDVTGDYLVFSRAAA